MLPYEWVRKPMERCGSRLGAASSAMRMTPPRLGVWADATADPARTAKVTSTASKQRRIFIGPPDSRGIAGSLLVEPRVEQAHAETIPVVVLEPFHVGGVREVLRRLRQEDGVGLVGEIALNVVDDLLALLRVHLAPLGH